MTPRLQCLRPSPQMPTQACSCGLCRLTASEAPPRATARVGGCEVSRPGRAGALVPTPGGSPCSAGLPRAAHLYAGCRGLGTLFPQPPAGMGASSPRLPTQTPPEKAARRRDPTRSLPASIWGGVGDRAFWAVEDRHLPADRALSGHQSIMEPWVPGSKLVAGEEGHWPLADPTQLRRRTKLDSPVIGTEG